MSDNNIPFEIQMEIIKWLPVKPLIQFRSVSKPCKSVIDSCDFIKGYGAHHTQPHSHILTYLSDYLSETSFIYLVDDDIETFKIVQQQESAPFIVSPLLKQCSVFKVVGACHGLLCLLALHRGYKKCMVVIWNPCIGKSFGIVVPSYEPQFVYGFGVCPVTSHPTIVKVVCSGKTPWQVEVFSSGVWNVIPSANLPRQSIKLNKPPTQVVIDRFIYWGAWEQTFTHDGKPTTNHMVVSFNLITKEFKVVDLPDSITNEIYGFVSVSNLRGSLVVCGSINVLRGGVWVMEHDSSFKKLFTICAPFYKILGFRKNGEPLFETRGEDEGFSTLNVYDPRSQQIKNLGISGQDDSFFMGSYKESLLLLNHLDSHIYCDNN